MDVQFSSSGFEVNVAERLKLIGFQLREFYKHAPISREALKISMALPVQIGTHLLDLEVSHIAYPFAQSAFMSPGAAELKTLNQTSRRQHLARRAYNLSEADIAGENADNMSAACDPDNRLVSFGIQGPAGINLEKLRVQRSLEKTEHQFLNSYVDLR